MVFLVLHTKVIQHCHVMVSYDGSPVNCAVWLPELWFSIHVHGILHLPNCSCPVKVNDSEILIIDEHHHICVADIAMNKTSLVK